MSSTGAFNGILTEARSMLAGVDEAMAQAFVTLIDTTMNGDIITSSQPFPLDDKPDLVALANDHTRSIVQTIEDTSPEINWWQSSAERVPPGWQHRSAATELIGPEGSIVGSGTERFGLFYLSANIDYPNHWHNAEEFYLILAGSGEWTIDGVTKRNGPGDYSRTPSLAHHRIVTGDTPMLAMWGWSGDTSFDSYAY